MHLSAVFPARVLGPPGEPAHAPAAAAEPVRAAALAPLQQGDGIHLGRGGLQPAPGGAVRLPQPGLPGPAG